MNSFLQMCHSRSKLTQAGQEEMERPIWEACNLLAMSTNYTLTSAAQASKPRAKKQQGPATAEILQLKCSVYLRPAVSQCCDLESTEQNTINKRTMTENLGGSAKVI